MTQKISMYADWNSNWFQRHLNWTMVLGISLGGMFAELGYEMPGAGNGVLGIFLGSYSIVLRDIFTGTYSVIQPIYPFIGMGVCLPVLAWAITQKHRAIWWLGMAFVPIGMIVLLCLKNQSDRDNILEPLNELWKSTLMLAFTFPIVHRIAITPKYMGSKLLGRFVYDENDHYIELGAYFEFLPFCYEIGSILGRSRRKRFNVLEQMLGVSKDRRVVEFSKEMPEKRLEEFKEMYGREPNTFRDLLFVREVESATGLCLEHACDAYGEHGDKLPTRLQKVFAKLIPEKESQPNLQRYVLEGIYFGANYPDLTEQMVSNFNDCIEIDADAWHSYKSCNMVSADGNNPIVLSLKEQTEAILSVAADYYASDSKMSALGLRRYFRKHFRYSDYYSDWIKIYVDAVFD